MEQKINQKKILFYAINIVILIATTILLVVFKEISCVVDYARRSIENIILESLAGLNGIIFLIVLSKLIEKLFPNTTKKILLWIGKNTMGILFFHFVIFKILLFIFYKKGVIELSAVAKVVPLPPLNQSKYNLIFIFSGIFFSLILWEICKIIPFLNWFIVRQKCNPIVEKICGSPTIKKCDIIYDKITGKIKGVSKFTIKMFVLGMFIFILPFTARFIPNKANNQNNVASSQITITFPYMQNDVIFSTGWVPQSQGEKYRWVAKESVFFVELADQRSFYLEGYIPKDFYPITKMKIYVNDIFTREIPLKNDYVFNADIEIGQFANYKSKNEFKFIFDWERVPQKTDVDRRTFSALISKMILR